MSPFTKTAIEKSFLKLLNERPISKITVKDIVEECGINRNTFYYHFHDIPALLEEVIIEETNRIIRAIPEKFTLEESIEIILEYLTENKKAILHIWCSADRERYEKELMRLCEYVIRKYVVDRKHSDVEVSGEDEELIIHFLKCEFFGQATDWLNHNMSYDIVEYSRQMYRVFEGLITSAVDKCIKRNDSDGT